MAINLLNAIRKPLGTNKRLFGLVTIALLVIGVLGTSYWYRIKINERSFREYKLQTLDSYFDIISKRFANDIQTQTSKGLVTINQPSTTDSLQKLPSTIWTTLQTVTEPLPNDGEFDEYIVRFKKKKTVDTEDSLRYLSSLKGIFHKEIDSLLADNRLNIGVSNAIPTKNPQYQVFAREYEYQNSINAVSVEIQVAIIGLVSAERYKKSTRKLNSWIITLLVTFLLLCLFGLPFFKMVFIAEDERLNGKDVIMAGISILVGAPITVTIFLALINYFDSYYHTIPDRLELFGQQLSEEFSKENKAKVRLLNQINMGSYDASDCHTYDCVCDEKFEPISSRNIPALRYEFKFISKTDEQGLVGHTLNAVRRPKDCYKEINLKERIYFKDFKNGKNVWKVEGDASGTNISYVMRPVVSIEDQKEEAVYILRDEKEEEYFKVGSVQLRSVHNPMLPFGYQYAVIDDQGEVWFHSKIGRSTLENFFSVSRQYGDLKAAVQGRVAAQGMMKYRDEGQIFYVTHIPDTNLSVVTLYDLGLLRVRVSEVLSITGISIFFVLLLIGLVALFSVLVKNTKMGLYKFQTFPFEFLTPKAENEKYYILLSTLFLAVLAIAVPFSLYVSFLPSSTFILSFLFVSWSYLLVYYSLKKRKPNGKIQLRLTDILLLLLIFCLDIVLLRLGNHVIWILLVVLPIQVVCSLYIFRLQQIKQHKTGDRWVRFVQTRIGISYPKNYVLFLFAWLLLASVFPTSLFFKKAKELNHLIWTKTDQFYMSREYLLKEARIKEKLPEPALETNSFDDVYNYHLSGGQYLNSIKMEPLDTISRSTYNESNDFRELLWSTRPIYDEKVRSYQAMIYRESLDMYWKSIENRDSLKFQMNVPTGGSNWLTSLYPGEGPLSPKSNSAGVMEGITFFGLFGILAVLFALISFFVDRFIGFRFMGLSPNDFDTNASKEYALKFAEVLKTRDANSGLLLTGLPFSGKTSFAKRVLTAADCDAPVVLSFLKLTNLKEDASILEVVQQLQKNRAKSKKAASDRTTKTAEAESSLAEKSLQKECAFIIENLEHHLMSFSANRLKLRLISFLISLGKPVILCSEVYPSQILGFYQNIETDDDVLKAELLSDFNAWRNILSAFPQILIGITDGKQKVMESIATEPDSVTKQLVADELGFGKFLPTLAPVLHAKNLVAVDEHTSGAVQLDFQRMVMHTQHLSHGYYTDIWNSLPTRERYMLYDLAKDGFLNIKNSNSLFSLMKKGLIVWRDRPAIFNHSFKNFISSSVSMNEALRLEYKNRGEGSWGTMRIVFYLIILTIIVFIFLGEPGLLDDFEALVGALGGIGVIIPLLSAMLARGGQKS